MHIITCVSGIYQVYNHVCVRYIITCAYCKVEVFRNSHEVADHVK